MVSLSLSCDHSLLDAEFLSELLIALDQVKWAFGDERGLLKVGVEARLVSLVHLQIERDLNVAIVHLNVAIVRSHSEAALISREWRKRNTL